MNLLTKEECINALSDLKNQLEDILGEESENADCVNVLNQLIEEHFSNPSLKFEELKEGMWVWDNQLKWFFKVVLCDVNVQGCNSLKMFKVEKYEGGSMLMIYEPNRFYRKEVQE